MRLKVTILIGMSFLGSEDGKPGRADSWIAQRVPSRGSKAIVGPNSQWEPAYTPAHPRSINRGMPRFERGSFPFVFVLGGGGHSLISTMINPGRPWSLGCGSESVCEATGSHLLGEGFLSAKRKPKNSSRVMLHL